ncbi:hypothetical protein [Nodosilinea sp. E11]|uniref:hypothetical protein n=1 Tax=Nodosilinea sp. E11 TaxID=3037479 RepID=UPI0029351719|nr:hypothetical protein [Nodosilinea sp. E11]WOD38473.1 hypothetical protein RRF56_19880 [Nodosilinea sp. E11]
MGTPTGNAQLSQLTAQALPEAKQNSQGQRLANTDRLNDLYRRYNQAKAAKENVDAIVKDVDRAVNPPTREQAEEVLDRGHYQDGLKATLDNDPKARGKWLGEHFKRVQRSWLYAVCELRSLGSSGGCGQDQPHQPRVIPPPRPPGSNPPSSQTRPPSARPLNPGGQAAVPGNTNRQRLGISARPAR